ncbi:MAG: phosphate acyltransferase PlsX [Rickettsiales bacterium]|jgi:glycerol-3-phosphate acyltransferase PlsX|nr:phosphate acyltransferase PlsX [Rickettsiales bacterium]
MSAQKIIAIDAMGGDHAPRAVLGGINQFLFQNQDAKIKFRIFGDERRIRPLLKKYKRVAADSEIIHSSGVIKSTDKPRDVIRHASDTSMYMAVRDVREGNSVAVVSAGNTGVLMALSKLALKTLDGISRPAITTMLPSGGGDGRVVMLDLGANIQYDAFNLFDFAIMGSVYSEIMARTTRPKLGILNIGEEDQKGDEVLIKLNKVLQENAAVLPYHYVGFVEGTDISAGLVDVVVTDGFTGNIVLKTVEGTAKLITRVMKETFYKSWIFISLSFMLAHVFKRLKNKLDPRSYAGAVFLGLNGFSVKTHGNSDAIAFANAISYAANLANANFNDKIAQRVEKLAAIRVELGE